MGTWLAAALCAASLWALKEPVKAQGFDFPVQVAYAPIEYVGRPLPTTFTQFLVRVRNFNMTSPLDLSRHQLILQYWMDGPRNAAPSTGVSEPAGSQAVAAQCEWATTGCNTVGLRVKPGRPVPGATLVVELALKAGLLVPTGQEPAFMLGNIADVLDVLVNLSAPRAPAALFL